MLRITNSKSKNGQTYLTFTEVEYDEMGIEKDGTKRIAFKEVQADKAATALAYAKSKKWVMGGEPDNNGFYQVSLAPEAGVNELKVEGKEAA